MLLHLSDSCRYQLFFRLGFYGTSDEFIVQDKTSIVMFVLLVNPHKPTVGLPCHVLDVFDWFKTPWGKVIHYVTKEQQFEESQKNIIEICVG